jgi:hypothetical protein
MQKWTIRLLIISTFFFLISCKSYKLVDVVRSEFNEETVFNSYFSDVEIDYVYKAHIEVYGNDLSGIFVAKKINDSVHRVVFATDFGNKLLDFEISENDFKVNYIVEDLDRKLIVNTLQKDFQLLLKQKFLVEETLENQTYVIYKSKQDKRYNYLFKSKQENKIIKLIHASKRKEKVVITFESKDNKFADNIIILHHNIKLKIELNKIEN